MRYVRSSSVRAFIVFTIILLAESLFDHVFAQVPDDIRANLTGHGHALLIGVWKYDDDAWPELRSVTADIEDLARGLTPHFITVETLINPTTRDISIKLREFMTGRWNRPNERLLIYYAGHGFTDYNINSRIYTGYITGKDTPACHGANCDDAIGNAIPFSYIDSLNRETRVRQVLNLFDSCFSGLAVAKGPDDKEITRYSVDRAREEINNPVRYYITSGGPTEKVPADSPFGDALLAAGVESGHIYEDQASGKRDNRPGLEACLKALR